MRLQVNLVLLGLGLVGSALADSLCCIPNCGACLPDLCGGSNGDCNNSIFNTCCADEKKRTLVTEEEYLASIA
ncbi:hypothetical protein DHEL01_v200575 [Diaporthe helianthi]|uniref:Uncharacterized protein n=1 Tax=Diaporthe helianthi TaxID=158607 RepID=A0A2P5IET6_DIAHE|nr:hypothetical protein DHEL01_v200575 [Diaporthe helianthi]